MLMLISIYLGVGGEDSQEVLTVDQLSNRYIKNENSTFSSPLGDLMYINIMEMHQQLYQSRVGKNKGSINKVMR